MLVPAIADLFKHKLVGSVMVLVCWSAIDRIQFTKQFSFHGISIGFSCNSTLYENNEHRFYGVLVMPSSRSSLKDVRLKEFSHWYKWVIVDEIPDVFQNIRYDSDIVLLHLHQNQEDALNVTNSTQRIALLDDIYVHPRDGLSTHNWAYWTQSTGLQITHERERILRRFDLKQYPLRIATPMGQYSEEMYSGSFKDYLLDLSMPEHDGAIRSSYAASVLLIEALKAKEVNIPTELWSTELHNSSMLLMLTYGSADISGGCLRILPSRITRLDYAFPIWTFRVGFTYLSERESSSNMFVAPFTVGVWLTCLGFVLIMAIAQRITAKKPVEKEGAYMAVLATYLQQDASAVPESISGRWTFVVLSISSMLIHAYYTSAIVSDLMSTGRSGPDSLTALADSRYAIASEDYDYMRYSMFDVKTNRSDLEYLKKKKMTSQFYVDIQRGVELIGKGQTAFHTEYNQLYPHLKTLTDDQSCKLQYVDTIAESTAWVTMTKRGQWCEYFRTKGRWIVEVGLTQRIVSQLKFRPPPCRAALLAERVKFGDIIPVLILSTLGAALSLFILFVEIILAKFKGI